MTAARPSNESISGVVLLFSPRRHALVLALVLADFRV